MRCRQPSTTDKKCLACGSGAQAKPIYKLDVWVDPRTWPSCVCI
jgi:hypothetical protein